MTHKRRVFLWRICSQTRENVLEDPRRRKQTLNLLKKRKEINSVREWGAMKEPFWKLKNLMAMNKFSKWNGPRLRKSKLSMYLAQNLGIVNFPCTWLRNWPEQIFPSDMAQDLGRTNFPCTWSKTWPEQIFRAPWPKTWKRANFPCIWPKTWLQQNYSSDMARDLE